MSDSHAFQSDFLNVTRQESVRRLTTGTAYVLRAEAYASLSLIHTYRNNSKRKHRRPAG